VFHSTHTVALVLIGLCAARAVPAAAKRLPSADCHPIRNLDRGIYWTQDRLNAARPYPLPTRNGDGPPGMEPPAPAPKLAELGLPATPDVSAPPFRSAGKLYFKDVKGLDSWCTAQFAGTRQTVLTAAHCVRSWKSGRWHTKFLFVQGEGRGRGQAVQLASVTTWRSYLGMWKGNHAYDYAFFFAETPSDAGWMVLGMPDPHPFVTAIGYPRNLAGGEQMYNVSGRKLEPSQEVISMEPNPMGTGSSGGAWLATCGPGQACGLVVGLNSFRHIFPRDRMSSPRFDDKTMMLMIYAAVVCR
jgi:hypothetical protein